LKAEIIPFLAVRYCEDWVGDQQAETISSSGLRWREDRTSDQQVGLVVNTEFIGQEFQGQKQVRGRGRLGRKAEVAKHVGG
jgi:hypothetical protein